MELIKANTYDNNSNNKGNIFYKIDNGSYISLSNIINYKFN